MDRTIEARIKNEILVNDYDVFIKAKGVALMTSLSVSTIYKKMKENNFPKPIRVSEKRVAWSRKSVMSWLEKQKQLSSGGLDS
ncbi:MAG: AlpA family phage regulatory protein [Deltaproteobacteria bacterium]|nr:AlpA family phage regulatory protein [Deltaproteobacteria bacterium]